MAERLTEAQRNYLKAAARRPLLFSEIRGGPSAQCANDLASRGLLCRDVDNGQWNITPRGRTALASGGGNG